MANRTPVRSSALGPYVTEGTRALWAVLRDRSWSQADLARALETPSGTVNRLLHGTRRVGLVLAMRIEAVVGVDASLWTTPPRKPLQLRPTG